MDTLLEQDGSTIKNAITQTTAGRQEKQGVMDH